MRQIPVLEVHKRIIFPSVDPLYVIAIQHGPQESPEMAFCAFDGDVSEVQGSDLKTVFMMF